MTVLEELCELAQTETANSDEPTVAFLGSEGADAVVALLRYFGEDASRNGVSLMIKGERLGRIRRRDVLRLVADVTRGAGSGGWGNSTGMTLPGHAEYTLLRLRCPVAGCSSSEVLIMNYNEDDPPRCSIHPDVVLERV